MYSKCEIIEDARKVFDRMPQREAITWTTIVTGYAQNGLVEKSLKLFWQMQRVGMRLNDFTFSSVIKAGVGLQLWKRVDRFMLVFSRRDLIWISLWEVPLLLCMLNASFSRKNGMCLTVCPNEM